MINKLILVIAFTGSLFSQILTLNADITVTPDSTCHTIQGFGGFGAKKVWRDSPSYYNQGYLNQVINTLDSHESLIQIA